MFGLDIRLDVVIAPLELRQLGLILRFKHLTAIFSLATIPHDFGTQQRKARQAISLTKW